MNYLFQRTQGEFVFRRVIHINPRIFSHFIKLPPRGEQLTAKPKGKVQAPFFVPFRILLVLIKYRDIICNLIYM